MQSTMKKRHKKKYKLSIGFFAQYNCFYCNVGSLFRTILFHNGKLFFQKKYLSKQSVTKSDQTLQ